jgi:hypothetical protein
VGVQFPDFESFKISDYLKNTQSCSFFKKQINPEDSDWEENTASSDILKSIDNLLDSGKISLILTSIDFPSDAHQATAQSPSSISVSIEAL